MCCVWREVLTLKASYLNRLYQIWVNFNLEWITLWICVWIHRGYLIVKKLECKFGIKALLYTKDIIRFFHVSSVYLIISGSLSEANMMNFEYLMSNKSL